jgi:hypothetical protein
MWENENKKLRYLRNYQKMKIKIPIIIKGEDNKKFNAASHKKYFHKCIYTPLYTRFAKTFQQYYHVISNYF